MSAERNRPLDEAALHAWIDREIAEDDCAAFVQAMKDDPGLARRVERFRADQAALREALSAVLDDPVPARLRQVLDAGTRARPRLLPIAAALALFVAGALAGFAGGGWWRQAADARDVIATQALDAHLVYVGEVRHPVEVGAGERDHLVAWLSKRLGGPLKAPDLAAQGFSLVGGRLLPATDARAAAQFMYEDAAGERVTLYVSTTADRRETAFRVMARDGAHAFYWLDGPFGYALAGTLAEDRLLRLAHIVHAQLATD